MVMSGHVKKNLPETARFHHHLSLLAGPQHFVPIALDVSLDEVTSEYGSFEGCYLYYDKEQGNFIRSGKVVGPRRGFADRHKEHKAASAMKDSQSTKSKFYCSFPSKEADEIHKTSRQGYFEDLQLYCGIGYDGTKPGHKLLWETATGDSNASPLFDWGENVLKKLEGLNFRGALSVQQKQLHMVAYLFELAYDLALPSSSNVSESPGFELPLGVFGGSRRE